MIYSNVLFAGTFDHLHDGHKYVLSEALSITNTLLYIGLTTDSLIGRKRFAAALEPLVLRKEKVHAYMEALLAERKSLVKFELIETPDSVGPAATLDFDALVVTPETIGGALAVNSARNNLGFPSVVVVTVPLFGSANILEKMSSTAIRERICLQLVGGEEDLKILRDSFPFSFTTIGSKWWSIVRDMYGLDLGRHYHTLRHISELVALLDDSSSEELLLAIWFHDCVYDPKSVTNEESSVSVFQHYASETHLSSSITESVSSAILMTKDHLVSLQEPTPKWTKIFLEMDLAIFGSEPERYLEYACQIRKEYSHVTNFDSKRCNFIKNFSFFEFTHLKNSAMLNKRLQINIQAEIDQLSKQI